MDSLNFKDFHVRFSRSVQIPYGPEFFSGLISTTILVVFITARIDSIFVSSTAVHIHEFHIFTALVFYSLSNFFNHSYTDSDWLIVACFI